MVWYMFRGHFCHSKMTLEHSISPNWLKLKNRLISMMAWNVAIYVLCNDGSSIHFEDINELWNFYARAATAAAANVPFHAFWKLLGRTKCWDHCCSPVRIKCETIDWNHCFSPYDKAVLTLKAGLCSASLRCRYLRGKLCARDDKIFANTFNANVWLKFECRNSYENWFKKHRLRKWNGRLLISLFYVTHS